MVEKNESKKKPTSEKQLEPLKRARTAKADKKNNRPSDADVWLKGYLTALRIIGIKKSTSINTNVTDFADKVLSDFKTKFNRY